MPHSRLDPGAHRASRRPAAHRVTRTTQPRTDQARTGRSPHRLAKPSVLTAVLTLVIGFAVLAPNAQAGSQMYIGAAGDSQGLAQHIGAPLDDHAYAHFQSKVPPARMITVQASVSWPAVAAASPGSAIYSDIVRWAQTIKVRSGTTLLAYHHEPEAAGNGNFGSAADFGRAFRRVVSIFRAQGVHNVAFVWQMTAYAFRTSPNDPRYAAKWYPGDAYVDNVGGDAYNWYTCGHGNSKWTDFSTLADPVVAFARAHHKQASFPEFAADANARRAQWVVSVHQYLIAHRDVVSAAFYFQRGPTTSVGSNCRWPLNTSTEYKAYGDMARDATYFRT